MSIKIGMKVSYISGNFEILHAGHIRIMSYAKSISDYLIVGVYVDPQKKLTTSIDDRIRSLEKVDIIDEIKIIDRNEFEIIGELRPNFIIKSPEHKGKVDDLQKYCEGFGTQIIFTSANIFNQASISGQLSPEFPLSMKFPDDYVKRHNITRHSIKRIIKNFSKSHVFVVGDLIIDEYVDCHPIGMSQEDPTLVVTPQKKEKFLGGSAIVAAHLIGLGAQVDYASIVGADEIGGEAGRFLDDYGINYKLFVDGTRCTSLKQRIRAKGKTLLRISHLSDHDVGESICDAIYHHFINNIQSYNMVILSDFNYGCLPTEFANKISSLAKEHGIPVVADSQASSQLSDISRFQNLSFLTPTEHEVQLALNDRKSNLVILAEKLANKTETDQLVITLGESGIIIYNAAGGIKTDRIGALNLQPTDVSGAGDSFLSASSLALSAKANIWEAALIGSFMAAIQVQRLGNRPITRNALEKILGYLE